MAERETRKPVFSPTLDIVEKSDSYLVKGDLPGTASENIEVHLEGDLLTIKGNVNEEPKDLPRLYREYNIGDFETTLRIAGEIDRDNINAELKDGILTLTLPKSEKEKPRQIKVNAA
ncbi:MAG: Hsp20/alpha crystallin family protein [bacterium]